MITLDQVQLKSVHAKFHADRTKSQGGVRKSMFSSFCDFAKKKTFKPEVGGQSQSDSAESVNLGISVNLGDTKFLNVRHMVWEL